MGTTDEIIRDLKHQMINMACRATMDLMKETEEFGTWGRRNDDMVNLCIVKYAQGVVTSMPVDDESLENAVYAFLIWAGLDEYDVNKCMDHARRIIPYVESWWNSNPPCGIFNFMIDNGQEYLEPINEL